MKTLFLLALLHFTMAGSALAQFKIPDWAMDSGGGRATGGVHRVRGSIGQPSGGAAKSDHFALAGGFFGFVGVIPAVDAPTLRLIPTPQEVILAWPSSAKGFQLQQSPGLTQPAWTDVPQGVVEIRGEYQVRVPWQRSDRFFRLRRP